MLRLFWNEGGVYITYAESPEPPVPAIHPTTRSCVVGNPAVRRASLEPHAPVPRQSAPEQGPMLNAQCAMPNHNAECAMANGDSSTLTLSIEPSALGIEHSAFRIEHSAFGIEH
jgi:hypothetical protein